MACRSQSEANVGEDDPPSEKRRKVEPQEENIASPSQDLRLAANTVQLRHRDLWWCDGNVVIAAKGVDFRLHAGILSWNSSVFNDLLEDVHADGGPAEMLEGCPVLRVDEDGASLAELFMVVYHGGRSGFFDWRKPIEFVRLRRITLLALRYKIQHIVDEAIARLEHLFPTTFVPDRLSIHSYVGEKEGYPVTITDAEDAIAVVNLGRAIDSENPPAFIVTALYFCLALSVDDILNGVAFHGETAMLSPADRDLCLRQTDEVLRCNYVVRQPVVDALEKPLCSSKACEAALQSAVCHWIRIKAFTDHLPLEQLSLNLKVPSGAPAGRRICKPCETELLKAMEQQQRKVFEGLGAIFEISSWPTPAET